MRTASCTWSEVSPPLSTASSWDRTQVSQIVDGTHREAKELEIGFVRRHLREALHAKASRLLRVLLLVDDVPEPVKDVVHRHQDGCGPRVFDDRLGNPRALASSRMAEARRVLRAASAHAMATPQVWASFKVPGVRRLGG